MDDGYLIFGVFGAAAVAAGSLLFAVLEQVALRFTAPRWAALIAGLLCAASVYGAFGLLLGLARIISMPRGDGEHKPTLRFWLPSVALLGLGGVIALVGWRLRVARDEAVAACSLRIGEKLPSGLYVVACQNDERSDRMTLAKPYSDSEHGTFFYLREVYSMQPKTEGVRVAEVAPLLRDGWRFLTEPEYKQWVDDYFRQLEAESEAAAAKEAADKERAKRLLPASYPR